MRLFSGWKLRNYIEMLELLRQNKFVCSSQQIPAIKLEADVSHATHQSTLIIPYQKIIKAIS
jgi:hypothetical protein